MSWVAEQHACPECGVDINQRHQTSCAMRSTGNQVVWFGPTLSPGMMFRTVAEGDIVAGLISCMHCEHGFDTGDVIAENRAQTTAIHAKCLLELAALIPRSEPSVSEVRAEYERRRAELANGE